MTPLTPTERVVLRLVANGLIDRQIAQATGRSPHTIHTHVKHLLQKQGAVNRAHLVSLSYQRGLLP